MDMPHHHHSGSTAPSAPAVSHESHSSHLHGGPDEAQKYLRRFYFVTILLVPLFIVSEPGMNLLGYPDFFLRPFLEMVIATVIFGFSLVFFEHARHEIRSRKLGMMTLVSLAVGAGYLFSTLSTFFPTINTDFYLEISTLIWVLLFGHYLEAKSSTAAGDALQEVAKILPKEAHVVHGSMLHDQPVAALKRGDTVLVKPGEKVPADGVISKGMANFDESHLSGESIPVTKQTGDRAIAGSICLDSTVEIKLDRVGVNSTIGQIQKLIGEAQHTKPSAQRLADKAASWLTIIALSVALATLVIWSLIVGETFVFALTMSITVLVIACPHALGLAIPTVTTIATRLAVQHGFFIKDLSKLEVAKAVNYVVFDKTGTLTQGKFGVTQVIVPKTVKAKNIDTDRILQLAATLETSSSHVIGQAIVNYAKNRDVDLLPVTKFKNHAGKGISGTIDDHSYFVGNPVLMDEFGVLTPTVKTQYQALAGQGSTVVLVATDREVIGLITLSDQIKPGAKSTIDNLHQLGLKVALLTGDNQTVAGSVAKELNIDTVFAQVLPEHKYSHIKALQSKGHRVMMVGDGVNDAPALTQADVGVAIGAGTDVAVEAGDIVLTRSDPQDVVSLIRLSRKVYAKMVQNLWWALGYNAVAIPAAAGLFIPFGIYLSPQIGALAMALSSVIVVLNALSLRRAKL